MGRRDLRLPLASTLAAFALAGCAPDPAPLGNGHEARAEAAPAIPASAPHMAAAVRPAAAAKGARRCGWLSNPTPGNWWLTDSKGEWILATQGGDQAPGMDEMPDMSVAGWVETNGPHGYGCACMTIAADPEGRVTRVADARPKPLKLCRGDRSLPKPE